MHFAQIRKTLPLRFARVGAFMPIWVLLLVSSIAFGEVEPRTLNDGNLILEDIPEIPREVFLDLYRFQNVRAAAFRADPSPRPPRWSRPCANKDIPCGT